MGVKREDVTFRSGRDRCAAWIYEPRGDGPCPAVVLAHGFTGTRRDRLGPFAERFAAAGILAVVFDYRGFGDSGGADVDVAAIERQLRDWAAALAFARGLRRVDPDRVAVWGTSLGGGHALSMAQRDPAPAAAVCQVPFLDSLRQFPRLRPRVQAAMAGHALLDLGCAALGRPPHTIAAVSSHGSVGYITAPRAMEGWLGVVAGGEDSRWRNRAAARTVLARPYRPARRAAEVACPVLFCVGDDDLVARPKISVEAAKRAPRGELRRYPIGHFDPYDGEPFERIVADQVEFLCRNLLPGGPLG
jgi:pimeloyl-ACP methyl ester carboxylesterase